MSLPLLSHGYSIISHTRLSQHFSLFIKISTTLLVSALWRMCGTHGSASAAPGKLIHAQRTAFEAHVVYPRRLASPAVDARYVGANIAPRVAGTKNNSCIASRHAKWQKRGCGSREVLGRASIIGKAQEADNRQGEQKKGAGGRVSEETREGAKEFCGVAPRERRSLWRDGKHHVLRTVWPYEWVAVDLPSSDFQRVSEVRWTSGADSLSERLCLKRLGCCGC